MNVDAIVREWLKNSDYDGLVQPGLCGCLKSDLAPCGEMQWDCIAGYKGPCTCGEGCDFDVYEDRPITDAHKRGTS